MFIRQTWSESRLQLPEDIFEEGDDHVTLPPEFFDNLWHPDPYFLNSKVTGELGMLDLMSMYVSWIIIGLSVIYMGKELMRSMCIKDLILKCYRGW